MSCESYDWKAYALGELDRPARARPKRTPPLARTAARNWPRLRLTLDALSTLREEEIPRRIAFVSDKVFEPRWWQRCSVPLRGRMRHCGGHPGARFRAPEHR